MGARSFPCGANFASNGGTSSPSLFSALRDKNFLFFPFFSSPASEPELPEVFDQSRPSGKTESCVANRHVVESDLVQKSMKVMKPS